MFFRPLFPYSLLLGLGLLGACGQSQGPPATTLAALPDSLAAVPTPAAAPTVPPDSLLVVPAAPVVLPESLPAAPKPFAAGPLPILDTLGTVMLSREAVGYLYFEEVTPLLRVLVNGEWPRLFYRPHPRDTTWLELELEPDGIATFDGGPDAPFLEVKQVNLDGRGKSEVLLRFGSEVNGSGGGTQYGHCYLLDPTPPRPRLLLRALTGYVHENRGNDTPEDERSVGYDRAIHLRGPNVYIAPATTVGRVRNYFDASPLTPLQAGRYRYQGGKLRRVGP